ncbi:ABC transporter permease [Pseudonocardia kujensis]|uniref:ABC transporter permease n=1 Tax=Pseudonocardia kujensis TaxID=1128675 RepID=UPI001E62E1F6|nr:ABC transporter permease [Pseudonocardia kujensis]MCE0766887.1 ABC transporter permease [Pseudonocardia kujensis]
MSAVVDTEPPAPPGRSSRPSLARLGRDTPALQVLVLLLIFGYGAFTLRGFGSLLSVKSMLLIACFVGLAALGQTVLVLLGHLDLSVPGFIGLGNLVTAILVGQYQWGFLPTLAVVLGASVSLGAFSGYVCHRFRVESIVITLGMNFVVLGGLAVLAGSGVTGSAPEWLTRFASVNATTLGIPVPPLVVLWVVLAVITGLVLRRTVAGRRVYLTGANPKAAAFTLVRTGRVVVGAFVLSAVSGALTGVLLTGFSGAGDTNIGNQYLFTSLTAIIVGGTSITGARGNYWRSVIGAVMLTILNTVLLANGFTAAEQQILFGLIILLVALAYSREAPLRDQV